MGEGSEQRWTQAGHAWYFLADRDVGWLAGSASLLATQVSAGTLVGAVGLHYAVGVSFALAWAGIWADWLFSMVYVAPQLRSFGGVTVPEFLGSRFNIGAGGDRVQAVSAVVVVGIYLVFTSAQYTAGGVVLESAFGVPPVYGMALLAVLALVYTAAGGMWASVVTDVVLTVALVAGLVVATAVGVTKAGGFAALHAAVLETDPALLGLNMSPVDLGGFALAFGLSLSVAPYEVSRVFAMRDERTVQRAITGSLAIQVVVAACVVVLGLLARVEFPGLATPDAAVVRLITAYFGPVVGGLLLLGILAAILSTIDSILLVSASAIAYDLHDDGEEARSSSREGPLSETVTTARIATVASAVVPLGLAVNSGFLGGLVQLIVLLYSALIAGAFFVPVVLGLHWGGLDGYGAVASMIAGAVAVFAWHLATSETILSGTASTVPPVVVGVAASLIAAVGVSLVTRQT